MTESEDGKKKGMGWITKIMIACVVVLALAVGGWLAIFLPTLNKGAVQQEVPLTPEQKEAEKQKKADEAEASATWQTYHCNMLHRYYKGREDDLPMGELLGLGRNADEAAVKARCKDLVPAARNMGGWINSQPQ